MPAALTIEVGAAASLSRSFARAKHRATPFPNWRLENPLPELLARDLAGLPFEAPRLVGPSGARELHNATRRYLSGRVLEISPAARHLAETLQSTEIVRQIAGLTGARLDGCCLRIEYALDREGFWLAPHTDIGVKALTLFVQLGEPGQEDLGTDLYDGPDAWAERIGFGWNSGFMFVPSNSSWHGFEPRSIPGVRRSLIVNYVTPEWRERRQLAFPDRPVRTV